MRFGDNAPTNWRRMARDLSGEGKSPHQIRETMEARGCLAETARRAIAKLQEKGHLPRVPQGPVFYGKREGAFPLDKSDPGIVGTDTWITDAATACDLHLADLKAAGHRPGIGEYRIRRDLDKPTHYVRPGNLNSYFGSSSAACAELGE